MTNPPIPCTTCEMRASCARDRRCLRPQSAKFWTHEVEEARQAFEVAANRLLGALQGLAAAMKREAR